MTYNNVHEVEILAIFIKSIFMTDCNSNGTRVIVFGSVNFSSHYWTIFLNIMRMARSNAQLFTIHGNIGNTSEITDIAFLRYCLVSDKTKETYADN